MDRNQETSEDPFDSHPLLDLDLEHVLALLVLDLGNGHPEHVRAICQATLPHQPKNCIESSPRRQEPSRRHAAAAAADSAPRMARSRSQTQFQADLKNRKREDRRGKEERAAPYW
ncbi:unnamed protein product [Miscanthus lutarioriparius]|uniref:Uncharacterized protein n=1 Tax=Miscanthus lutarioriparius TaxID=422564 RepID=A0A811PRA9_9POAL|nr:unnamed protein product [Miscanthus lutarioriparius]